MVLKHENGELTLLGKLSKWLVPVLLTFIGVLLSAAWNDLKSGQSSSAAEIKALTSKVSTLSEEVASLKTAVTYIDRYGLPAGPRAVPSAGDGR